MRTVYNDELKSNVKNAIARNYGCGRSFTGNKIVQKFDVSLQKDSTFWLLIILVRHGQFLGFRRSFMRLYISLKSGTVILLTAPFILLSMPWGRSCSFITIKGFFFARIGMNYGVLPSVSRPSVLEIQGFIFFIGEIIVIAHEDPQFFGRKDEGAVAEPLEIIE